MPDPAQTITRVLRHTPEGDTRMPLGQHLEELRKRVLVALLGLVPIVAAAFYFGGHLLRIVLAPAEKALREGGQPPPQAVGPIETFGAYMRVSMIVALVVGSPWILYQLWRFISPGLHRHEKRFVYFLIPLSAILTSSGVFFLFKVVLPLILSFLVTFGTTISRPTVQTAPVPDGLTLPTVPVLQADPPEPKPGQLWYNENLQKVRIALPIAGEAGNSVFSVDVFKDTGIRQNYRVSEVLSMMLTLVLAFAGAFQAPILVLLLGWAGVIDRAFLKKYRRHAALICAVIAAAVMPGDPVSMLAMALPLYMLFELGGLLLWLFPASRVAGKTQEASDAP
jgi:sec-independent protein translocase protein TatC